MRAVLPLLALLIVAVLGAGCGSKSCTDNLAFGLNITVLAPDRAPVCDAKVTARDGAYSEELIAVSSSPCTYVGAQEREGDYQIEVERTGFLRSTVAVAVGSNDCHVNEVSQEITLTVSD